MRASAFRAAEGHGGGALVGAEPGHPVIIRGGGDHDIDATSGGGVAGVTEVDVVAVAPDGPIG